MDYLALRERPSQFLALTSLQVAEFDDLLTTFGPAWERHHRSHILDGALRRQPVHQECANAVLAGTDTKLFFCSPTEQRLATTLSSQLRRFADPCQPPGHVLASHAQPSAGPARVAARARRSRVGPALGGPSDQDFYL